MFRIYHIRENLTRALRVIQISTILLRFLIIGWLGNSRFWLFIIPKRYKNQGQILSQAVRARILIEDLGPTFVKFGQILADRPDVISVKLREELKKLQNKAYPFDHYVARKIIEDELGQPIEETFSRFDMVCIGSASIGQVYKATLKNGLEVVLKVQRPDVQGKIKSDLHILKYVAKQMVKEFPGFDAVDIVGIVDEFGETIIKEFDYLNEAANAIRFAEMFKDKECIKIPRVYTDMTTSKLLVMEYVAGISADNVDELIANGLEPKKVAHNGIIMLLEMVFKHGFFHADPHAGNVFIQPGNRIALIDFGMVGTLKPAHMQFLAGFTMGLAMNNAGLITDALLTLCGKKYFAERDDLEFMVQDMLARYGAMSYEKINFSNILNESVKIIQKHKLKLPASMYLLLKALATVEKFGYNLDPEISLPEIIKPYAEHMIKQKISPANIASDMYEMVRDYLSLIRDFPSEINEILYRFKSGKIGIDINLQEHEVIFKSVRTIAGLISLTIIICCMVIGSTILLLKGKSSGPVNFMFATSMIIAIWTTIRLFIKIVF